MRAVPLAVLATVAAAAAAVAGLVAPRSAAALDFEGYELRRIEIEGNDKTAPDVIETIAGFKDGQPLHYADIRLAKTRLLSSGLFSRVNIYAVPDDASKTAKVVVVVEEKASWFIAPFGGAALSNVTLGVAAGEQNLGGFGKRVFGLGALSTGKSLAFVTFWDPALFQSPVWWRIELLAEVYNMREYGTAWLNGPCAGGPPALFETTCRRTRVWRYGGVLNFGVNFTRAFSTALSWRFYQAGVSNVDTRLFHGLFDPPCAPGPTCGPPTEIDGEKGLDTSWRLAATFDNRTDIDGLREGAQIELGYEMALPELGAHFPFGRIEARANASFIFADVHNVILRGIAGYAFPLRSSGVPDVPWVAVPYFRAFRLGGATLRGYPFDYFRGDTLAAAQAEWVFPIAPVRNFVLRGVVFADAGAAWYSGLLSPAQDGGDCDPMDPTTCSSLNHGRPAGGVGAGVGIRLYLKTVVLPLVGVDVAYGFIGTGRFPDVSGLQVNLNIGITDF
jgi:outer membrane protein insertion porin family